MSQTVTTRLVAHRSFLLCKRSPTTSFLCVTQLSPSTPVRSACTGALGFQASTNGYQRTRRKHLNHEISSLKPQCRLLSTDTTPSMLSVTRRELPNDGGVEATITICNTPKLNIINTKTIRELRKALKTLEQDDDVRTVIFTGQADPSRTASFCAGANIQEMESISTPEDARTFISRVYEICEILYRLKPVTICRIDGLCFGAGLELAACCDLRYGTERSTFSMKEVAVGLPSVVHARLLANIMGWQAAKRMILLAKVWSAQEAHRTNLLDEIFPTPGAMDKQLQEDVDLMGSYGRKTMRVQKDINLVWEHVGLQEGINYSIDAFATMWEDGGTEPKRAMGAWMNRRRSKKPE